MRFNNNNDWVVKRDLDYNEMTVMMIMLINI
jgi:hypothetical protein